MTGMNSVPNIPVIAVSKPRRRVCAVIAGRPTGGTMRRSRRRFLGAIFVASLLLAPLSPAQASSSSPEEAASIRTASAVPFTNRRVCAPRKCVTIPPARYCSPDSGCGQRLYKSAPAGQYCSSSSGCFTYKGKNYFYTGYRATPAQHLAAQKCAAGLGVTWLGAIGGGPVGITILGVAASLWGCS
jgi:hypothetical protein